MQNIRNVDVAYRNILTITARISHSLSVFGMFVLL